MGKPEVGIRKWGPFVNTFANTTVLGEGYGEREKAEAEHQKSKIKNRTSKIKEGPPFADTKFSAILHVVPQKSQIEYRKSLNIHYHHGNASSCHWPRFRAAFA